MPDADGVVEQEAITERPKPAVATKASDRDPVPQQRRQVDLENFYKDEVARRETEYSLGQKAWKDLEKAAASRKSPPRQDEERQAVRHSIIDKIHRQSLLLQARLEGIKNLDRFQELADYFESTVEKGERKTVKVPKGLPEEQKREIIEHWKTKGWHGETYDIREYSGERQAVLKLKRYVPLRLERKHIKLMKGLVSGNNDPVELAKGLRKIGFWFTEYSLGLPDEMRKLSELFSAPHAKEALELAQGISMWDNNWFVNKGSSGNIGRIEFLTQIAKSPDPKTVFPPQLIQKVNTLARALNMRVGPEEIRQLQTITKNPYYLEFAAYISKLIRTTSKYSIPTEGVFENIVAIDRAGLLKPVVELYRLGISIKTEDTGRERYYYSSAGVSLATLFNSSRIEEQEEKRQALIQDLQEALAQPEVQSFLNDPQKKEFTGLLMGLRGYPLSIEELSDLDKLFGEGLSRKKEAVFVLRLLQESNRDGRGYDIDLNTLAAIAANSRLMKTFTNKEFPEFIKTLENKTGYRLSHYDLYLNKSSKLARAFNNQETRQGLVKDSTTEFIKALGGKMRLYNLSEYIKLGDNPNMVHIVNALRSIGLDFSDDDVSFKVENLENIANYPDALQKLMSPELKVLAKRLAQEYKWEATAHNMIDLLELFDDRKLQRQLFIPENSDYIKKVRPKRLSLLEIRPMMELNSEQRRLLGDLIRELKYSPLFSPSAAQEQQEMLGQLTEDDELRTKLFSSQTQEVLQKLRDNFHYFFNNLEDVPDLLRLGPVIDSLPATVAVLREAMKYKFNINDSQQLVFIIEGGYNTREQLTILEQIYDKYKNQHRDKFNIYAIQDALLIKDNQNTISRLESYNWKFPLKLQHLKNFLEFPDKDKEMLFQALDILPGSIPSFVYNPNLLRFYIRFVQIPDIKEKLGEVGVSVAEKDLMQENNFILFVSLRADPDLYNHARKLLSDDYFINIRDAKARLKQFNERMMNGEIPDEVLAKIFTVSGKATELDRIALLYGISAAIAKIAQKDNWQTPLLRVADFQEADRVLTKTITNLAIPVIYPGLADKQLGVKQDEIIKLVRKDREFGKILEIACRSVGIYGQKYPDKGQKFNVLTSAIRQSLELNLERNPKAYLEKRAQASRRQFDRIFEGMSDDVKQKSMEAWLDLSPKRRLRTKGGVVLVEEDTLSRLDRIRDVVRTDLSTHLQELFAAKARELEKAVEKGGTNKPGADLLSVYKQYLMTPEGAIRQDIPMIYRSIEKFIRDAQVRLKDPEIPKKEKGELGKSMAIYRAISSSLKSLYRMGTISERKYKSRKGYLNKIERHIEELSGALKKLNILDPDRRSTDVNVRALEEEVLIDLSNLKVIMKEESISKQMVIETESTVAFIDLATAPEMTTSCQRLTEVTGYNQAAYSRLIDGANEMINAYEEQNGKRIRLGRSFIELSKVRLEGGEIKLTILVDREYINPQYQNLSRHLSDETLLHVIDRISGTPELSLIFNSNRFSVSPDIQEALQAKGYKLRKISGEYFINESNVGLVKYYDSLGGMEDVSLSRWKPFTNFYIVEKA